MSDPHPADADYLSQNLPNEADLDAMMESALVLADTLQGRRRVDAEGRGVPVVAVDPGPVQFSPPQPPARYPQVFAEEMRAALARPRRVAPDEAVLIQTHGDAIAREVTALRGLSVDDPVFGHALNSVDLGLIGLARVVGGGGDGGS